MISFQTNETTTKHYASADLKIRYNYKLNVRTYEMRQKNPPRVGSSRVENFYRRALLLILTLYGNYWFPIGKFLSKTFLDPLLSLARNFHFSSTGDVFMLHKLFIFLFVKNSLMSYLIRNRKPEVKLTTPFYFTIIQS